MWLLAETAIDNDNASVICGTLRLFLTDLVLVYPDVFVVHRVLL